MVNKDFLKAVFMEEKGLLKLSEVKFKNVPFYDELAVKKIWPEVQKDHKVMFYMPFKLPKGRVPDRDYMFNVLNTLREGYVTSICEHANR
jgi:hypothetical protein